MSFFKLVLAASAAAVAVSSTQALAQDGEKVKVTGDFRFRTDKIDDNTARTNNTRHRMRFRLGVSGKVNDKVTANARISTGSGQSSNQTVGDQTTPAVMGDRINATYDTLNFDYKFSESMMATVGAFSQPFWKPGNNEMIWGPDTSLHGANAKWKGDMGSMKPFATLLWQRLFERTDTSNASGPTTTQGSDIDMWGLQLGSQMKTDMMDLKFAAAHYMYNNTKRMTPSSARGNSTSGTETCMTGTSCYQYDYKSTELGVEAAMNMGFAPVGVWADYVQNSDSSNEGKGMAGGAFIGKMDSKKAGTWDFTAGYRDIQRDAILAYWNDPGSIGGGGTNSSGADYRARYAIDTGFWVDVRHTSGTKNKVSTSTTSNTGHYALWRLDLLASY